MLVLMVSIYVVLKYRILCHHIPVACREKQRYTAILIGFFSRKDKNSVFLSFI